MTIKEYSKADIIILWKVEKCIHSGVCKNLTQSL